MTLGPSDHKRFRFVWDTIRAARPQSWASSRILDLGCGPGLLEDYLGARGVSRITGVDLDQRLIEEARADCGQYGHEFFAQSLEDFLEARPAARWDFAVCSEVLMHLDDPGAVLAQLSNVLEEDGLLIVTVPNGFGPWEKYHRRSESHMYEHPESAEPGRLLVQRFTRSHLVELMADAGLVERKFQKSNFVAGVYPFNVLSYRRHYWFERMDCWLADHLPHRWVSGWYFAFGKNVHAARRAPAQSFSVGALR